MGKQLYRPNVSVAALNLSVSAAFVFFLLSLIAARGEKPFAMPETAQGKLLGEWLHLVNDGDEAKLAAFVKAHYGPTALRGRAPEEIAKGQLHLRTPGGIDAVAIEHSSPKELVAVLRAQDLLPKFLRLSWTFDHANPETIAASSIGPSSAPPSAGVTRLSLEELGKDLETKLEELTRRNEFSGVVLIAKDGKPAWQKAFGLQDRDAGTPNNVETRFRLGSMNKMLTSVAIAQLVERGKLKFTDTLASVLPDYPNKEIAQKITVEQLLTHTSGLGDFFNEKFEGVKDKLRELNDYLPLFVNDPLQFEPGKKWSYSNAGFIVLGLIVEKLSGANYYDYIQHHVYDVARMKESGDIPKTERPSYLAVGYMKNNGKLQPNWEMLPWRGMSAGGGDSTAGDLLRFANALRSSALLSPAMTKQITTGKVEPQPGGPIKYAFGFLDRNVNGRRFIGHGGGAEGMNADLSINMDNGYTTIVLANLDPPAADDVVGYILDRLP